MRSKTLQRILNNTSPEVEKKVRKYATKVIKKRTHNKETLITRLKKLLKFK